MTDARAERRACREVGRRACTSKDSPGLIARAPPAPCLSGTCDFAIRNGRGYACTPPSDPFCCLPSPSSRRGKLWSVGHRSFQISVPESAAVTYDVHVRSRYENLFVGTFFGRHGLYTSVDRVLAMLASVDDADFHQRTQACVCGLWVLAKHGEEDHRQIIGVGGTR